MSLWPNLPFHPEEALLSYVDRLSVFHTGRGMERLLRDLGINTEHFTAGREETVVAFARAVGIPLKDAQQSSIRVFSRGASFRDEDISKLTSAETEEATDIGFSIYSEGPEAIEEALDAIRYTSPAKAVQAGPLAYYGQLFDWLDRRSNAIDPGPIRDLLRDHIVKHSAIEPGTKVLGLEITERRYHTLHSLSATVGIARPRLSRLLKKLGEIPAGASEVEGGNMVFEAAKIVPLIRAFKTAVSMHDVAEYIGASKRQVETLYRKGIIRPLIPRTGRGLVRQVVFAREHLDSLLRRTSELPEMDERVEGKFHSISYACQRGAGCFEDVLAGILEDRIPGFRNTGKVGIGAIYVDVHSVLLMKNSA